MSNLHTIKEWESHIPVNARFEKVSFNSKREVTKVSGVLLLRSNVNTPGDNRVGKCYIKVHWDGFGQCYVAKNKRKKKFDIIFGQ